MTNEIRSSQQGPLMVVLSDGPLSGYWEVVGLRPNLYSRLDWAESAALEAMGKKERRVL